MGGSTRIRVNWRTIELWTIPAEDLLAAGDVGLIPWVPLASYAGPPEPIFCKCRERIERDAPSGELENLLAVTQSWRACVIMIRGCSRFSEGVRR